MSELEEREPRAARARRAGLVLVSSALLVYVVLLLRTAWLCDDAYITFRTVDNLVHGRGLTWNVDERVQVYTHPLWMACLAALHAVTREMYFTPLLACAAVSLAAVLCLAFRVARRPAGGFLGVSVLLGSRAFMDFSTGGLENGLAHLLLLVFYMGLLRGWSELRLGLFLSGILLTRTDLVLFVLPGLVAWSVARRWSAARAGSLLLGLAPLFLWHGFALFYYGHALPNTALAKLGTGIARLDLARQGLVYLRDSWRSDPLTLSAIAAGCLASARLGWRQRAFALGILCYLAYVVSIGGDFMSGRFLTAPLVGATALLVNALERARPAWAWAAAVAAWGLALLAPYPNLRSGADFGQDRGNDFANAARAADLIIGGDGISDERAWTYRLTGLLLVRREEGRLVLPMQDHVKYQDVLRLRASGQRVLTIGAIGFRGFYLGPGVHVLDKNALADPLLARLSVEDRADWRISHFTREIPEGYAESLAADENLLRDPHLARVYDALRAVTRGPLLRRERLREIWRLNTGYYDEDLAAYLRALR